MDLPRRYLVGGCFLKVYTGINSSILFAQKPFLGWQAAWFELSFIGMPVVCDKISQNMFNIRISICWHLQACFFVGLMNFFPKLFIKLTSKTHVLGWKRVIWAIINVPQKLHSVRMRAWETRNKNKRSHVNVVFHAWVAAWPFSESQPFMEHLGRFCRHNQQFKILCWLMEGFCSWGFTIRKVNGADHIG